MSRPVLLSLPAFLKSSMLRKTVNRRTNGPNATALRSSRLIWPGNTREVTYTTADRVPETTFSCGGVTDVIYSAMRSSPRSTRQTVLRFEYENSSQQIKPICYPELGKTGYMTSRRDARACSLADAGRRHASPKASATTTYTKTGWAAHGSFPVLAAHR
jgi:hypothetical protein